MSREIHCGQIKFVGWHAMRRGAPVKDSIWENIFCLLISL